MRTCVRPGGASQLLSLLSLHGTPGKCRCICSIRILILPPNKRNNFARPATVAQECPDLYHFLQSTILQALILFSPFTDNFFPSFFLFHFSSFFSYSSRSKWEMEGKRDHKQGEKGLQTHVLLKGLSWSNGGRERMLSLRSDRYFFTFIRIFFNL